MSAIKVGIIGGSGMGDALGAKAQGQRHEIDTPFGKPSDAIVEMNWEGLPVYFLSRHGAGHTLGPTQVPFRANIFALKMLGVTHLIASGAVGSLRDEFKPRDLVIADQIIDKTSKRAGTFFEKAAVHVEFAEPFCPVLRQILIEQARPEQVRGANAEPGRSGQAGNGEPSAPSFTVHQRGCYVCMEGPAFSTRAESLMHRLWGGDLIGMTAMPEAKLAREAEIAYALVALVTDYDCWRKTPVKADAPATSPEQSRGADASKLLEEIIANLSAASDNAVALIRRAIGHMAAHRDALAPSPAHDALKLAIWSDKSRLPADEVERLAPLWIKYFR